jgi:ectoine hydroxylase
MAQWNNPGRQSREFLLDRHLLSWEQDGIIILRGFFKDFVNHLNSEIEFLIKAGKVGYNFTGNKIVFANRVSGLIRSIERDETLVAILNFLMGREVVPFQTINFHRGSEQKAHSDSIHMSTYPEGYLLAVWVALDKVEMDNGPVFYYPGSHKWPYIYNEDLGLSENSPLLDVNPNRQYENIYGETNKGSRD